MFPGKFPRYIRSRTVGIEFPHPAEDAVHHRMFTFDFFVRLRHGTRTGQGRRPALPRRRLCGLVLLLPSLAACAKKDSNRAEARKLLQTIAQSVKRLSGASRTFGETVVLRLEDRASDTEVQAALDKFRAAILAQRDESENWSVPPTPQGESLVATFRANLDRRVALLDEYRPRILEALARNGAPITQRDRAARQVFDDLSKEGDKAVVELRAATLRYAADSGIFSIQ